MIAQRLYAAGLFATTLSYNPSKQLNFFIDTGLQSPETKHGSTAVVVDLGTAYIVGQNVQLDFSAGSRVEGKTSPRLFLSCRNKQAILTAGKTRNNRDYRRGAE